MSIVGFDQANLEVFLNEVWDGSLVVFRLTQTISIVCGIGYSGIYGLYIPKIFLLLSEGLPSHSPWHSPMHHACLGPLPLFFMVLL